MIRKPRNLNRVAPGIGFGMAEINRPLHAIRHNGMNAIVTYILPIQYHI